MLVKMETGASGGGADVLAKSYTKTLSDGNNNLTFNEFSDITAVYAYCSAYSNNVMGFLDSTDTLQTIGYRLDGATVTSISGNQVTIRCGSGWSGSYSVVVVGI